MKGTMNTPGGGLEELADWWRGLSPLGHVRVATGVALTGAGTLAGYLFGVRHLRLLALAYARSHPNQFETAPGLWLMDPLPHIWPYMLGGAVLGAVLAVLLGLVLGSPSMREGR